MKTSFDKETGVTTWSLTTWFQKAVYVIGYITTLLMGISFLAGFVSGVVG